MRTLFHTHNIVCGTIVPWSLARACQLGIDLQCCVCKPICNRASKRDFTPSCALLKGSNSRGNEPVRQLVTGTTDVDPNCFREMCSCDSKTNGAHTASHACAPHKISSCHHTRLGVPRSLGPERLLTVRALQ